MNRKTRAILSLAVMLSLGTAAPVWAAEVPSAPQVQQQEPDFVTTADQAIRDVRTVGGVDTDGSRPSCSRMIGRYRLRRSMRARLPLRTTA